jgi:sugar phosphate isomerase/epimerase
MDMSRVSVCSIAFLGESIDTAMEAIAAAGFTKVDLLGRLPHFSLDPMESDPAAVRTLTEEQGLQIANLGTYVGAGFASEHETLQEAELHVLCRAVDLAAFFGSRSIRVRPGDDNPRSMDRIVPWFRRSADYAAQRGIYMGFENHGGGISGNPDLCRELATRVASPFFGVLYEPYNLMEAGVDYQTALHTMGQWIVHVHFKDGVSTKDGFRMTHLGQGEIDISGIIQALSNLGYDGDFALEYDPHAVPVEPLDPPEAGLRTWYDALVTMD